ncbi:hypothetical protein ActroDRAFT_0074 [Actinospica robiniae DSM 44927]|uniref:Uncharacterized protein n=1 Tax=Actinospica robiniae DSM 44927 TaxID=479430 RepID=W9DZ28_9ACTN|nr:hypothetical protein ActroDRAFT_0074 [Actinospica robiniae DSM 44927]
MKRSILSHPLTLALISATAALDAVRLPTRSTNSELWRTELPTPAANSIRPKAAGRFRN